MSDLDAGVSRTGQPEASLQGAAPSRPGSLSAGRKTVGVVGAGPAGLVAARALRAEGLDVTILERHTSVGGIWDIDAPGSPMYESAHFISSKHTSGFLGFDMPTDFPDYPDHRKILRFIRDFAKHNNLVELVRFESEVSQAKLAEDGTWAVYLASGETLKFDALVCANGVTWDPNIPSIDGLESFTGEVRHSVTYRKTSEFEGKSVLVVGAGNSGVDIACDAARSASSAFFSVRRGYWYVPKLIAGVPTDVFLQGGGALGDWVGAPPSVEAFLQMLVGDVERFGLPAPDHAPFESHPIMNTQILHHLAHGDITAKPDIARLETHEVVFVDGSREQVDLVLLATGYHHSVAYLDPDIFDWKGGRPDLYLNMFHRAIPNLSVLGAVEFASAAYKNFDHMAQLIAADLAAEPGSPVATGFADRKANHFPDVTGGHQYVDSPRHANYVEVSTYLGLLDELRDDIGLAKAKTWV